MGATAGSIIAAIMADHRTRNDPRPRPIGPGPAGMDDARRATSHQQAAAPSRSTATVPRDLAPSIGRAYDGAVAGVDWDLRGTYLESCNCEAICPCRRIGGEPGGRSTYGECLGVLSWEIDHGRFGDVELSGLRVVIVSRYHDDEPRSPWTFVLFIHWRAEAKQAQTLVDIFTGAAGGTALSQFPWAFKPSTLVGWRPAEITIDHTPGQGVG